MPDYGPVPMDALDDQRLRRATLAERSFYALLLAVVTPHGKFLGDPETLAHTIRSPSAVEVEGMLVELIRRKVIRLFMSETGQVVGEVLNYSSYHGLPDNRRFQSKLAEITDTLGTEAPDSENGLRTYFGFGSGPLRDHFCGGSQVEVHGVTSGSLRVGFGSTSGQEANSKPANPPESGDFDRTSTGLRPDFDRTSSSRQERREEKRERRAEGSMHEGQDLPPRARERVLPHERDSEDVPKTQESPATSQGDPLGSREQPKAESDRETPRIPAYQKRHEPPRGMSGMPRSQTAHFDRFADHFGEPLPPLPPPKPEPTDEELMALWHSKRAAYEAEKERRSREQGLDDEAAAPAQEAP